MPSVAKLARTHQMPFFCLQVEVQGREPWQRSADVKRLLICGFMNRSIFDQRRSVFPMYVLHTHLPSSHERRARLAVSVLLPGVRTSSFSTGVCGVRRAARASRQDSSGTSMVATGSCSGFVYDQASVGCTQSGTLEACFSVSPCDVWLWGCGMARGWVWVVMFMCIGYATQH